MSGHLSRPRRHPSRHPASEAAGFHAIVNVTDPPEPAPGGLARAGRVAAEAVLVALAGAVVAFAANAISPRGIKLSRDYFPGTTSLPAAASPLIPTAPGSQSALEQRLQQQGLAIARHDQVVDLFHAAQSGAGSVLFIDARSPDRYQEGHIPGALEFDPYHPELKMAAVLPVCLGAGTVVVYCSGGDCEDSEFAAVALRNAGVPASRLLVYPGGIAEWKTNGLPLEAGEPGEAGAAHTP
jgi:rhodanese-related sulfurtransferase